MTDFVSKVQGPSPNAAHRARAGRWARFLVLALFLGAPAAGRATVADLLAGRAALEDGLFALAEEKFEKHIRDSLMGGSDPEGGVFLVQALYGQGKYLEAADWVNEHRSLWENKPEAGAMRFWYSRCLYQLGRYEEVRDNLKGFQNAYPDDLYLPQALRLRAHANIKLRDYEEAARVFEGVERRYAGRPEAADNLLDWAGLLVELGRKPEAEKLLRQVIADYAATPAAAHAALWLGRIKAAEGESAEARELLAGVAARPDVPADLAARAWYGIAEIDGRATNYAAAVKSVRRGEQAAADASLQMKGRIFRAVLLARQGRLDDAVELLTDSIREMPTNRRAGEAQLALGELLLDGGRNEQALEAFQHFLEAFTDPAGEARALAGKGWSLWNLGRYAEAATVFGKAAEGAASPADRISALVKQADSYAANAQYRQALDAYTRVAGMPLDAARRADVFLQMALCQTRLEMYDDAERALVRAREEFAGTPAGDEAWMRLAALAERQKKWKLAAEIYTDFLKRPREGERAARALIGRAQCRIQTGEPAVALADIERVVADHGDTPWAEQAAYLGVWCLDLMGETKKAVQACQKFLKERPESAWAPQAQFWLAEKDFNEGRYAEAESRFDEVRRQYPSSSVADEALFWAGKAAAARDEFRKAAGYFNELVKTYTNSPRAAHARFAQGDALSEMGEFAGAILAFDDIIRNYPGGHLADRAAGRKGDCQFTLGSDRPDRYQEALASYRAVMDSPSASADLKMQAEFKLGRCYEKMGRRAEAEEHYMNVVYGWLAHRGEGGPLDPIWFIRSAFSAAAMKEQDGKWDEAVRIYQRVGEAGVPAGAEALKRIEKIRTEQMAAAP